MSKFDYINRSLSSFRDEDRPEWRIRKSAEMLNDKRNKGKQRTEEMKAAQSRRLQGNQNRKNNQKSGTVLIELGSGLIGLWLDLKDSLNINTNLGTKAITKNRRLIKFNNNGSYEICTYPTKGAFCFMPYAEYLKYKEKYSREPSPFFEYPQIKELKSGIIGDSGYITSIFPEYSGYYLNKVYTYKYKSNPWKNGEQFISCSKYRGVRKYEICKDIKPNLEIKNNNRIGRRICQLDADGNIINKWDKIKDAAEDTGINAGSIQNVAAGRAKTAGGYKFKYIT